MKSLSIQETKNFMQHLFTQPTFNTFEVRGITVHSFTYFEISGDKGRDKSEGFCTWEELKPYLHHILKGKDKPRSMKIIFAAANPEAITPNAAALFINISYEADKITCTTGSSQKQFDLNKTVDTDWDNWVIQFFQQKNIQTTQE